MEEHGWWDNYGLDEPGSTTTAQAIELAERGGRAIGVAIDALNKAHEDRNEVIVMLREMIDAYRSLVGNLNGAITYLMDQYRMTGDPNIRELANGLKEMIRVSNDFINTPKEEPKT